MRRRGNALPWLLGAAGAVLLLTENKQATAAATSGGRTPQPGSWTLLPKADTIELDPSRHYAAVILIPGIASMAVDAEDVQQKLSERAEWAEIQVWSNPDDVPWTVSQAFSAEDKAPAPGRYWIWGRPKVRKSIKADNVVHAYARAARPS
jgi:hypothetical protein